jgi:hypothetical protein
MRNRTMFGGAATTELKMPKHDNNSATSTERCETA